MKNVQPDMNVNKQLRKALQEIVDAIEAENMTKAIYILDLTVQMMDGVRDGQPQPWSYFQPRIAEEFDD